MNILIVDDDQIVCQALQTILKSDQEITVIAIGHDGQEAILLYEKHFVDVVLMDIRMTHMSGIDAAEIILRKDPHARILFLTTFSDDDYIVKALKLGARGYILKQDYDSIATSVKAVHAGQCVYGNEISTKIPLLITEKVNKDFTKMGIMDKEIDIMEKIAEGLNNKEIAQVLFLSEGTVRNYITSILRKLDLRDRTQLAIFYLKNMNHS